MLNSEHVDTLCTSPISNCRLLVPITAFFPHSADTAALHWHVSPEKINIQPAVIRKNSSYLGKQIDSVSSSIVR